MGDEIRELEKVLDDPDAFRSLVDRLPDPRAIAGLKAWGRRKGYYPGRPIEVPALSTPPIERSNH